MSDTPQTTDPRAPWTAEECAEIERQVANPFEETGKGEQRCVWCWCNGWIEDNRHDPGCPLPKVKAALAHIAALEAANRTLTEERDAALKQVYIGDHHFPDLTWKVRCEETAAALRQIEARLAQVEAERDALRSRRCDDIDAARRDAGEWAQAARESRERAEQAEADRDALTQRVAALERAIAWVSDVVANSEPQPPGGQHVGPPKYNMTPSTRKELRRALALAPQPKEGAASDTIAERGGADNTGRVPHHRATGGSSDG